MKEETRLKKEAIKKEIKEKYLHYFDLLVNCGGALPLQDFSKLLGIEYTKTTRDLKKIENDCNFIKSYTRVDESSAGTPRRNKIICLTRPGWRYMTGKERNEVKFENPETMDNIKLKAYKYARLKNKQELANKFKSVYIEQFGSSADEQQFLSNNQEKVDVEKTLSDNNLIITGRKTSKQIDRHNTKHIYNIEFIVTYRELSYNRLLKDLDKMISVFEYEYHKLYDSAKEREFNSLDLNIDVTCILRKKANISKFIHAKNKYKRVYNYYTVNMSDIRWWDKYKFKHYFKNVFKYIKFQLLDDEYNLIDL